jgi:hypothetical protein
MIINLREYIMNSYRSAYENYYKNINKVAKGINNKHLTKDNKTNISISSKYGINLNSKDSIKETLIKRVITELTGATVLLLFFTGLKYIPVPQVNELHIKCKQTLGEDFNYNRAIDVFNEMYIGKGLGIENITAEDFKIENLRMKAANFIENIRSNRDSN